MNYFRRTNKKNIKNKDVIIDKYYEDKTNPKLEYSYFSIASLGITLAELLNEKEHARYHLSVDEENQIYKIVLVKNNSDKEILIKKFFQEDLIIDDEISFLNIEENIPKYCKDFIDYLMEYKEKYNIKELKLKDLRVLKDEYLKETKEDSYIRTRFLNN